LLPGIPYAPSREWPARGIDAAAAVIGYSEAIDMSKPFTAKQGQYLTFIYYYSKIQTRRNPFNRSKCSGRP
jgi:hypothetical protein